MLNVTYPTSVVLEKIDQDLLPVLTMDDPLFTMFPMVEKDAALVQWEQQDNYQGLMQLRGFNNPSPRVPATGWNKYMMQPGVYGEYEPIDEQEITTRRAPGQLGLPISIDDLVTERQTKLLTRQINRQRYIGWQLLSTGDYSIALPNGAIGVQDSYAPQTFVSSVTWDTHATAVPLGDFRGVQIKHRGHSIRLGSDATAYMNRITFNHMIANTNSADLFGRRTTGLQTIEGVKAYNELAMKDDLPQVEIYDEGWLGDGLGGSTAGAFSSFIPPGVVVVCGQRTNKATIGQFQLTYNAVRADRGSAPYVYVWDSAVQGGGRPPRLIEVHRGFNGGYSVLYPTSVVVMTVGTFTS